MRIVLAGASGFLGQALREHLARHGHEVVRLVRGEALSGSESRWDPHAGQVDQAVIDSADVVVNLAGSSFYRWPLTEKFKKHFRDSRVRTTQTLAEAIARAEQPPAFLAQSGTSFYGNRGNEVLTEASAEGFDGTFLNSVTKEWEAACRPAEKAGARVCVMRTAPVLHKSGGAFRLLYLIFRSGLGGPAGHGQQYFPTISLNDWVRAVTFLAENPACSGVYNITGPSPTTNAEFSEQLGRMVHRPTFFRVPELPVRKLVPELAPELFSSFRVEPARLLEAGFEFEQPTLNDRLASALTP
ncbi:MAG TPA: TIGR01777 family oxidoreductase [Nocardioidaceae bacterium]